MSSIYSINQKVSKNDIVGAIYELKLFAEKNSEIDISNWCQNEIYGYSKIEELPRYRNLDTLNSKIEFGYKDYPSNLRKLGYGYFDSPNFTDDQKIILVSKEQTFSEFLQSLFESNHLNLAQFKEIKHNLINKKYSFMLGASDFFMYNDNKLLCYEDINILTIYSNFCGFDLNGQKICPNYAIIKFDNEIFKKKFLSSLTAELLNYARIIGHKQKIEKNIIKDSNSNDFGQNNKFFGNILINSKSENKFNLKENKSKISNFFSSLNTYLGILVSLTILIPFFIAILHFFSP